MSNRLYHTEEWRIIDARPGYEISTLGRVRNRSTGNLLAIQFNEYTGYQHVSLWMNNRGKTYSIHRLVALAFLDKPNDVNDVNHIDGDKLNNFVDNLEWLSRGDNHRHAYRTRLRGPVRPPMRRIFCIELGQEFQSLVDAGRCLDLRPSSISNQLAGRRSSVDGLTFEYIDDYGMM